jgi:HEAT repeat protein
VILIIDGSDELSKEEFDKFTNFLEPFINVYIDIPIVLTASNLYVGKLLNLKFTSLAISPLSNQDNLTLTSNWTNLWYKKLFSENTDHPFQIKEKLFFNWSISNFRLITPLEFTLFIWGGLSGDLRGDSTLSIYESLFVRIFGSDYDPEKLSEFAHLCLEITPSLSTQTNKYTDISNRLKDFGIVKETYSGKFSFTHPDLLGFLASLKPVSSSSQFSIKNIVENPLIFTYSSFLASRENQSDWVENIISIETPPLFYNLFIISPWLRHSHQKCTWRTLFLKKLLQLVQNGQLPFGIRLRALGSIMIANDPSTVSLVKQLLSLKDTTLVNITLLALGSKNAEESLLSDLLNLFQSSNIQTQKYAALVLAQLNNQNALHALAKTLLDGEESLRQFIAEILATLKGEGVSIIKDAITMEDILVRRSAIFGLIRINENWALELLQKLSFEDNQWVIRNIALQAVEYLQLENSYIPHIKKQPHEDEWLIKFASLNNLGISPHSSFTPLIVQALKDSNPVVNSNGIDFINSLDDVGLVEELYKIIYSENQILSNKALEICWRILIQGMEVPSSSRFGFL